MKTLSFIFLVIGITIVLPVSGKKTVLPTQKESKQTVVKTIKKASNSRRVVSGTYTLNSENTKIRNNKSYIIYAIE